MRADIENGFGYDPRVFIGLPEDAIRKDFVKKVYATLAVQLGISALIAAPISNASDKWLSANMHWMRISLLGLLSFSLVAMCGSAKSMFRRHPLNLCVLLGFTICESVIVGFTCAMYEAQSVVLCLLVTTAAVVGISIFAIVTKTDVTQMRQYFCGAVFGLFVLGVMGNLMRTPFLQMLYAYAGALVFAGFLVYDTQMIVGGKHQHCRVGVDDYAFAALSVYLDIVRLFVFVLRIMGRPRNNSR